MGPINIPLAPLTHFDDIPVRLASVLELHFQKFFLRKPRKPPFESCYGTFAWALYYQCLLYTRSASQYVFVAKVFLRISSF